MKKILIAVSALCLLAPACKKDKDNQDCDLTGASLAGTYKVAGIKYKLTASSPEADMTNEALEECQRDNLIIIEANGGVEYQDLGVVCDPDESRTATWEVDGNTLTIDGESSTVQSFDCQTLAAYIENYLVDGDRVITYFRKQ